MSVWLLLRGHLSKSKSESLKPHVTGNVLEDWYDFSNFKTLILTAHVALQTCSGFFNSLD